MIDDDFSPDRRQIGALGFLLIAHQHSPLVPAMREGQLYERMAGRYVGSDREIWLDELAKYGLIQIVDTGFRIGDKIGQSTFDVCLTPAGIYYYISRAYEVGAQARTPTDDFPDAIVDAPFVIQAYYSTSDSDNAPTADGFVRFDHNRAAFTDCLDKLDAVYDALKRDNEVGSSSPTIRDEKLAEIRAIRSILEKREGWKSQLLAAGWATLGFLASQFGSHPIGFLAEQAWEALQHMLGVR